MKARTLLVTFLAVSLGSCSTLANNPAGVKEVLASGQLDQLDLATVIDDMIGTAATDRTAAGYDKSDVLSSTKPVSDILNDARTSAAIGRFYSFVASQKDDEKIQYRNEIQDRIIAAANQRCHIWKVYFTKTIADGQFAFGSAAVASSSAASGFTAKATKAALSSFASAATGIGALYTKSYLADMSLPVIYQGIEARRQNIKAAFYPNRSQNLGTYTLSAAIADALEYHGACSVPSGIQQASEALSSTSGATSTPAAVPTH